MLQVLHSSAQTGALPQRNQGTEGPHRALANHGCTQMNTDAGSDNSERRNPIPEFRMADADGINHGCTQMNTDGMQCHPDADGGASPDRAADVDRRPTMYEGTLHDGLKAKRQKPKAKSQSCKTWRKPQKN